MFAAQVGHVRNSNNRKVCCELAATYDLVVRNWTRGSMKTDSGIRPQKALYATKPRERARGGATSPVWNERGKALSANSFAYPKAGRQATAIRAKGNKR